MPVNVGALVYGVFAMVNIGWPRTPDAPWYDNWMVVLSAAVGAGVGAVYMFVAKPYERSDAISGDAVPGPSQREGVTP